MKGFVPGYRPNPRPILTFVTALTGFVIWLGPLIDSLKWSLVWAVIAIGLGHYTWKEMFRYNVLPAGGRWAIFSYISGYSFFGLCALAYISVYLFG